jgi:citronellol/citronellal dehydrogenase
MTSQSNLKGRVLFISGATRGIGLAIALRAAKDGAKIAVLGKTVDPHPKLEGTIDTACEAIREAGGEAIGIPCDIRSEEAVESAVEQTIAAFGQIDILVNNASAIHLAGTAETGMKRYDLMHQVNGRGTYLCGQKCLPHLKKSDHAHILTLSPPLDLNPEYFQGHVAYSIAKFSMSLCTLGWAGEFRAHNIAVNSLWPRTVIDTAAVRNLMGQAVASRSRTPQIVADAAYEILTRPTTFTGNFVIDDEILREAGVTDFESYSVNPGSALLVDLFVPRT